MRSKEQILYGRTTLTHGEIVVVENLAKTAMDEYAKEVAIEFYEWVCIRYSKISNGKFIRQDFLNDLDSYYTLEQLFNQFLQEIKQDK